MRYSESWLARQQSKKAQRTRVCWLFWILFAVLVAGGIIAVIALLNSGVLDGIGKDHEASASASAVPVSNGTVSAVPSASASATAAPGGYRR